MLYEVYGKPCGRTVAAGAMHQHGFALVLFDVAADTPDHLRVEIRYAPGNRHLVIGNAPGHPQPAPRPSQTRPHRAN